MAKIVLTNAFVSVNGVDISNHVSAVDLDDARAEVDVSTMGDVNNEIVLGLADATFTVSILQDYAAASLDSQMWPLHQTNTPFVVEVRPVNAARSTSNPAYTMTSLLPHYKPISGSVGAAVTTDLVFRNSAQAGVQRLTA